MRRLFRRRRPTPDVEWFQARGRFHQWHILRAEPGWGGAESACTYRVRPRTGWGTVPAYSHRGEPPPNACPACTRMYRDWAPE